MEVIKRQRKENPYGYKVDINHPAARKMYEDWKKIRNIPAWCPLSDEERFAFEAEALPKLEKQFGIKYHEKVEKIKKRGT